MARTQCNFRISEERLAQWDDHVETLAGSPQEPDSEATQSRTSPMYEKRSELIKIAVRNQIERDNGTADSGTEGAAPNGRIDDVLAQSEDNGNALEAIESRLTAIREDMAAGSAVPDAVASDVFDALPEGHGSGTGAVKGSTPSEIAEDIDASPEEAEVALAQLRRDVGDVQMLMTQEADEPAYWREG